MNIATNLKQLRHENNISQQQFADSLFVAQQSAANWETGKTLPQIDRICDIADKYDVSVSQLVCDDDFLHSEPVRVEIDDSASISDKINELERKRDTIGLSYGEQLELSFCRRKQMNGRMRHYICLTEFEYDAYKSLKQINPNYDIEDFYKFVSTGL